MLPGARHIFIFVYVETTAPIQTFEGRQSIQLPSTLGGVRLMTERYLLTLGMTRGKYDLL